MTRLIYVSSRATVCSQQLLRIVVSFLIIILLTRLGTDNYDLFYNISIVFPASLHSVKAPRHIKVQHRFTPILRFCKHQRDRDLMCILGSRHPRTEACRTNEETTAKPEARKRHFVHRERSIGRQQDVGCDGMEPIRRSRHSLHPSSQNE